MLIDFNCEIHGSNKLELTQYQESVFNSRKDAPHAIETWIKEDLECPICFKVKDDEFKRSICGVPLRFKQCTFENFDDCKEKKLVIDYAKSFKSNSELGTSLILCGATGRGKTHLTSALIFDLIDKNSTRCIYTKAFDLLREVKNTYNKSCKYTFSDIQEKYAEVDLLAIDEVGVQFGSDTEKQILFEIINDRYENLKPTILITNLSLTNLKEFAGDRVIDRMKENGGKIIVFAGESYRGRK